jgi:hypothetical protein
VAQRKTQRERERERERDRERDHFHRRTAAGVRAFAALATQHPHRAPDLQSKRLLIESRWYQNRWHSLVSCDHGDSTTSRFDSPVLCAPAAQSRRWGRARSSSRPPPHPPPARRGAASPAGVRVVGWLCLFAQVPVPHAHSDPMHCDKCTGSPAPRSSRRSGAPAPACVCACTASAAAGAGEDNGIDHHKRTD